MPPLETHNSLRRLGLLLLVCLLACGCQSLRTRNFNLEAEIPPDAQVPNESFKAALPPYVIEPPDVISIDAVKVVPKPPYQLQPLDILQIQAQNVFPDFPIDSNYQVEATGTVNLGVQYGTVSVVGLTLEEATATLQAKLEKDFAAPVVSMSLVQTAGLQQIAGDHTVAPDGNVNLGTYGQVFVAGLTIPEAKAAIEKHLDAFLQSPEVILDISSYNSKFFYIITAGAGTGDQVVRVPVVGGETVLDAISQIGGLSQISTKQIWIARPVPDKFGYEQRLVVDWTGITASGMPATNWQLMPGDRLYIKGDTFTLVDTWMARVTAPMERAAGFVLLGASSIRSMNSSFRQAFIGGQGGF